MVNENMKLGEGFSAEVTSAGGGPTGRTPPKLRHRLIGYGTILAAIIGAWFGIQSMTGGPTASSVVTEGIGLQERVGTSVKPKSLSGFLTIDIMGRNGSHTTIGPLRNQIVNAGETALRDCFIATSCTATQNFKFHGLGTSATAIAETDTGCITELTTQYNNGGDIRTTGTQGNNGANVYRTVGTNTVDASATVAEFCLMTQAATGGGTMWTRILTGTINLTSGDSVTTTYDLTIE